MAALAALVAACHPERPAARVATPAPHVLGPWEFSIGLYTGATPWRLVPDARLPTPLLTAADIPDRPTRFVADPFLVRTDPGWLLFFELLNAWNNEGEIAMAESADGVRWRYRGVVLDEPFHLSFPGVFQWQDAWYMVPESYQAGAVRLYRAAAFPERWQFVTNLIEGEYVDPILVRHAERWWMFSSRRENDMLFLHTADDLTGPWRAHPRSPIVSGNRDIARPGGRMLIHDGRLYRFPQDCDPLYGNQVRAFEITTLTPTDYAERELPESPILTASGAGWNTCGMHQIDAQPLPEGGWLAAVDGFRTAVPDAATPVVFTNGVTLEGVTLRPAREARPGDGLLAQCYWAFATNAAVSGLSVFVHFERGDYRFQGDHPLPETEGVSETMMTVPAEALAGSYAIRIGLYTPTTGQRVAGATALPQTRGAVTLPLSFRVLP